MEHITQTEINDKLVKLVPDEGYVLLDTLSNRTYSEACVDKRKVKNFTAKVVDIA